MAFITRKKRIPAFIAVIVLLLTALSGCAPSKAELGQELLQNRGFSASNSRTTPDEWQYAAYIYDDMVTEYDAASGELHIISYSKNDARLIQHFPTEKNTIYKICAQIKASEISGSEYGGGISVFDTFVASRQFFETNGVWQTVELYVNSRGETQLGVELRLGFFGNDAMGEVWFKDVSAMAVERAPAGVMVYDYQKIAQSAYADEGSEGPRDDYSALNACIALLFALGCFAAIHHIPSANAPSRTAEVEENKRAALMPIVITLFIALFLRLILAVAITGYGVDISCFTAWSYKSANEGVKSLYVGDYFCDYPPGYMYVLSVIGHIAGALSIGVDSSGYVLLIKLPAIICDVLAGYVIYKIAVKYIGERGALIAAAIYLFNPAVIVNSSAWGQIDGILALGVLLSVWLMINRKMFAASLAFALTVLMKPQGLMAGPLLLFAFIDTIREERGRGWLKLLYSFAACAALCLLAAIPAAPENPVTWMISQYLNTLGSYEYATVNAANLFAMFGANWQPQTDTFIFASYQAIGTVLMILVFICSGYLFFKAGKAGDRNFLPLAGAVFFCGVFVLGVRMHERYMFPALVLLLLAYLLYKDKRLLPIFTLLSATNFVNVALVLNHDHLMPEQFPLTFIIAAANLALLAWLLIVAFDIAAGRIITNYPASEKKWKKPVQTQAAQLQNTKNRNHKITRFDLLAMAVITVAYSVIAFINLGDTVAPISEYKSSAAEESVVFDFGDVKEINKFTFYGGIGRGFFTVYVSDDGENWHIADILTYTGSTKTAEIEYEVNTMFTWHDHALDPVHCRFAKIEFMTAGIPIIEAAFFDDGGVVPIAKVASDGQRDGIEMSPVLICDEQQLVPARSNFMNSMYFDEIYHARTAYEHMTGMQWYETTHPPLGKALMSFCIMLLGMTPFAWRLAGTLAGIIMLPGIYMSAKLLFRRSDLAVTAGLLMAFDCMHFAQTRIATIDSFVVMFIIWMYYFMLRYALLSNFNKAPLHKTLLPLLLSGIMFGLGSASKWTGIYAGAGLAVILFYTLYKRYIEARSLGKAAQKAYFKNFALTCLFCVAAFIIIPALIYYASWFQYFQIKGGKTFADWWAAQIYMFDYHAKLQASHSFESPWYQWPLMIRPMWLYKGTHDGIIATINTMGNPVIWWSGFAALVWLLARHIKRQPADTACKTSTFVGIMLLIGYASQLLPWTLVTRCTFIYHYFTAVPFIILMICHYIDVKSNTMDEKKLRLWLCVYLVVAALVFAFFYPVLSGMDVPLAYARLTRWLPTWTIWNY